MKRISILILLVGIIGVTVFSILAQECDEEETTVVPLEAPESVLPKKWIDMINSTDSVQLYIIDSFSEDTIAARLLGYGEILNTSVKSDSLWLASISNLLTNPMSFHQEDAYNECTFLPDVVMEFRAAQDTAYVMYCEYCDLCRFQMGEEIIDHDGKAVREGFFELSGQAFPKDKYLRVLNL